MQEFWNLKRKGNDYTKGFSVVSDSKTGTWSIVHMLLSSTELLQAYRKVIQFISESWLEVTIRVLNLFT